MRELARASELTVADLEAAVVVFFLSRLHEFLRFLF